MKQEFKGLIQFMERFDTEEKCTQYLIQALYPDGPRKCDCGRVMKYYEFSTTNKSIKAFKGFTCLYCPGKRVALKAGTMFYRSKLPLRKWFIAIYLVTTHNKGITIQKISDMLDISTDTSFHLLHRIRKSLHHNNLPSKLCQTVECDETYIGRKQVKGKRGRGAGRKKIVFGMIQRNGQVYAKVVPNCGKTTLLPIIYKKVRKRSKIITDRWTAYRTLSENYKHFTIKHSAKQYINGEIHTLTVEGFWNIVKSTIKTHIQVSKKHLQKYIDEIVFKYNFRKSTVSDKFNMIIKNCFEYTSRRGMIQDLYILDPM